MERIGSLLQLFHNYQHFSKKVPYKKYLKFSIFLDKNRKLKSKIEPLPILIFLQKKTENFKGCQVRICSTMRELSQNSDTKFCAKSLDYVGLFFVRSYVFFIKLSFPIGGVLLRVFNSNGWLEGMNRQYICSVLIILFKVVTGIVDT